MDQGSVESSRQIFFDSHVRRFLHGNSIVFQKFGSWGRPLKCCGRGRLPRRAKFSSCIATMVGAWRSWVLKIRCAGGWIDPLGFGLWLDPEIDRLDFWPFSRLSSTQRLVD